MYIITYIFVYIYINIENRSLHSPMKLVGVKNAILAGNISINAKCG